MLVTNIGNEDIILGLPWLQKTNPKIDWTTRTLQINKTVLHEIRQPADYHQIAIRTLRNESKEEGGSNENFEKSEETTEYSDRPEMEQMITKDDQCQIRHATNEEKHCSHTILGRKGDNHSNKPEIEESITGDNQCQIRQAFDEEKHRLHTRLGRINADHHSNIQDKGKLPEYCKPFEHIFSKQASERFPPSRVYDHAIELKPGFTPKDCPIYSLTPKENEALDEFIKENLRKGYIRPSNSPQASPIFFVPKKDPNDLRPCEDYRYINEWTIKSAYPLPRQEELFDKIKKAQYFTKLDLRNGYNNIRIKEGDEWKAAFKTSKGLFEPTVMFFGLCNSPATFQKFMDDIFRILIIEEGILIYMDDILIYSDNIKDLERKTKKVLEILNENDLYLKPEKCQFTTQEIEFLGITFTPGHMEMSKDKLKAITDWPTPKNVGELRKFLGFSNFYRRFIQNYANIAAPLNNLTGSKPWKWEEEQEKAFETLKNEFTKEPTLLLPDPLAPFALETDASDVATGGVLYQKNTEGVYQPCGFISNALSPTEQRYDIYDKELLAVMRATREWRHYLQHSPHEVTLWVDHKNLTYFQKMKPMNPRQSRWKLELSMFNWKLEYKAGSKMTGADALSRRPDHKKEPDPEDCFFPARKEMKQEEQVDPREIFIAFLKEQIETMGQIDKTKEEDEEKEVVEHKKLRNPITLEDIRKAQDEDNFTQTLLKALLGKPNITMHHWNARNNLLYHHQQIFVPNKEDIRKQLIAQTHNHPAYGHPGIFRTTTMIRSHYYWQNMTTHIAKYIQGCALCQQMKINTHPTVPPIQPIQAKPNARPFETITMDFITDLPLSNGYDALLVVVDHDTTKAIVLTPCTKTTDALGTAKLLQDSVFRRFGLPETIISDRGTQFASKTFQELCRLLGINSKMSTAYHPQTDGQSERTNQEIEAYLRLYCSNHPQNWSYHIGNMEFSHNSAPHSVTKKSPFELLLGYQPQAIPHTPLVTSHPTLQQRLDQMTELRKEAIAAHDLARLHMMQRSTSKFKPFEIGQKVWLEATNLRIPNRQPKLSPKREGPFSIKNVLSNLVYELNLPYQWKIHPVFHASLLTPYIETKQHGPSFSQPPPDVIEGEEEYEIEAIVTHRGNTPKRRQYLVKWLGYPSSENQWLSEKELQHSKELLQEYKLLHHL